MILSDTGTSRVNGYLFVLERSLRSFLPRDTVIDAVREIESHLRDRIAAADAAPDERTALESILAELGPPLSVAQAYSTERTLDEAMATGRFVPTMRAVWHLAMTTIVGFITAIGIVIGYAVSLAFLVIAVLKPIFPNNVGVQFVHGFPVGLAAQFPSTNADLRGGYWVIPIAVVIGLAIFVGVQRGARKFIGAMRERVAGVRRDFVG